MKKLFSILLCGTMMVGFCACEGNDPQDDSNADDNNNALNTNGHEYVDLELPSGTLWATCNVGAAKPEEAGSHFAWGEIEPKDNYDWSTAGDYKHGVYDGDDITNYGMTKYNMTDGKTTLDAADDAATANWGGSWRMPTIVEQQELVNECTWTWTTLNNISGYKVTGSNGNSIFLPAVNARYKSELPEIGSSGGYWSASFDTDFPVNADGLYFSSEYYYCDDDERLFGYPVRAVCSPAK